MISRVNVIKIGIIVFTLLLISAIFSEFEYKLKQQGYEPGWYYPGLKTVEKPYIDPQAQIDIITEDSFNVLGHKINYPINQQGFISTFAYDEPTINRIDKKKVMILGDSFTEGTIPCYDSTFVARLIKALPDLAILNFGVGGTDPLNYRLILQKYLPIVKPDLVVIAFCGGNDEMKGDNRKAQNKYPIMWNANFVSGSVDPRLPPVLAPDRNEYFPTVDSMYRFYFHHFYIDGITNSIFSNMFSSTRIGTRFWFLLNPPEAGFLLGGIDDKLYCHEHLKAIKSICDSRHTKVILAYIPPKGNESYKLNFPYMQSDCYYPVMVPKDYDTGIPGDIHWNEQGHAKFAAFLKPIIEENLK